MRIVFCCDASILFCLCSMKRFSSFPPWPEVDVGDGATVDSPGTER